MKLAQLLRTRTSDDRPAQRRILRGLGSASSEVRDWQVKSVSASIRVSL